MVNFELIGSKLNMLRSIEPLVVRSWKLNSISGQGRMGAGDAVTRFDDRVTS